MQAQRSILLDSQSSTEIQGPFNGTKGAFDSEVM